jgi:hypothetical protein
LKPTNNKTDCVVTTTKWAKHPLMIRYGALSAETIKPDTLTYVKKIFGRMKKI